ncbi:phosphatidylinositol phosphatase PTPRQ isoform X3 [Oryzias latipes]|uniref:phosphatidylinositol phosphatase PTPRQ isoform X3 n=1 Tax=Oryzias latipes TaxID=8090 RepID=UPI000CE1F2F7|nr:phosphatidylinositol phosphatase PTPRQ isoform X3 [Oryzias latipes]
MAVTEHLWLLCGFCQVVLLTSKKPLHPVEVDVVFEPFPLTEDADAFTVTCKPASANVMYTEHVDHSACSPHCRISLHMSEDQKGFDAMLMAYRNNTLLEAKSFHFIPVSLSSFEVFSTTTTAHLTWKLRRQQSISTLILYNVETSSFLKVFDINFSDTEYTLKSLQPGTQFRAVVTASVSTRQSGITVNQELSFYLKTAHCPREWLANMRSCYSVRTSALSWHDSQCSCKELAPGAHLADMKSWEDLLFVSSHLLTNENLLLLWTGLNDQQEEGHPVWSDGSLYNQTETLMSFLPPNQTDCFALQKNATGPGFFLTPFFCDIPLPYICQYQIPSAPASFSFDLVQVTERHAELHWSDLTSLSPRLNFSFFEIFLMYQERKNSKSDQGDEHSCWKPEEKREAERFQSIVRNYISQNSTGKSVSGLSPGSIYSFSLQASHPSGLSWTLGQTQTAYTRPPTPQNITASSIAATQVRVHWILPAQCHPSWVSVVLYSDVSTGQKKLFQNSSQVSVTDKLQEFTALIEGLKSYRKYSFEVFTLTQHGIWSCAQMPLTIQTALKPPADLFVFSKGENLSACWTNPLEDPPDGYHITSHPVDDPIASSLWSYSGDDNKMCAQLGTFTPGQTYEVGVTAVRGKDRSEKTSIRHTTAPLPVKVAVPFLVGTNNTQLYIQPPKMGLIDRVKVCACPGVCDRECEVICEYQCEWYSLPADINIVTISNLNPGSQYQLVIYSISGQRTGPPYYTQPIKTSLAPPRGLREGEVTESSIQLLWDPLQEQTSSYEVVCLNCEPSLRVQKIFSQSAMFSSLTPGSLYQFVLRTEKETYADSSPVTINITTAPDSVEVFLVNKTTSSICISWSTPRGLVSAFILSVKNRTSIQELIISNEKRRSYSFKGLDPGTLYTVEVTTISGKRRSKPANMILHTIPGMPQEVTLSEHAVISVFVTWKPPKGRVDHYTFLFGLIYLEQTSWTDVLLQVTSYEIRDLIPGSDYGISIQSVLGTDISEATKREFSTRPAGLCALHLDYVNSSSVFVSWNSAPGEFDFHRVTVSNSSFKKTLRVPKEEQVALVTGLLDGCSYNVSAERVKGLMAGNTAFLPVTTVPARVRGVRVVSVANYSFSLRWQQAVGCVDHYQVSVHPNQGKVIFHPGDDGYVQVDVENVSPGTRYTATVTAASSSNVSPGVSRMIVTSESVPGPPSQLIGGPVGSNGILLSWTMPQNSKNIEGYIIRYKEVCPYPDPSFTEVHKYIDIPETLITDFTSGSAYHIEVAAISPVGTGVFSKPLYIKTAESPPGLVTNLTAYAYNHTFVVVKWYLPHRINGLITKFGVRAKHARTGKIVRMLEVNAEDIMNGVLPHCNDAADILSQATTSPLEMTASAPSITLSAVPPSAAWRVPISVGVDQLQSFTAYLFEVSGFTSDGEGQIASTMVRMPESAPTEPPQSLTANVTSRRISVVWSSPITITGKYSYVLGLYGPTGFLYENSTSDTRFVFTGLTPYTKYKVVVSAKAAGELGPEAEDVVITPPEAPSAVQNLKAEAEDSISIRVSWRIPAEPNGPITQYRLQVLVDEILVQDITLTVENSADFYEDVTFSPKVHGTLGRRKRAAELDLLTSHPAFTATISDGTDMTASSFIHTKTDTKPTTDKSSRASDLQSGSSILSTNTLSPTLMHSHTLPPWLTEQPHANELTSDSSTRVVTPGKQRLFTHDASVTARFSNAAVSGTTGVTVKQEVVNVLSEELSYVVSELSPFTEYTFKVTASTTVGEGPAINITEKTREQAPSSVLKVSYENITSTSILVYWDPPLNPNGQITHYTIYGLNLQSNQDVKWVTNTTSILISDLDKYSAYKLGVAASTVVGESVLSEEDYIFVFTLEDEPDSAPENLTVEDTTPSTVTLTWSKPEKANGVIQYYEVLLNNASFTAAMNTTSNRVTLTSLKPFSYYNVSVRAYTRYGHGNQTSNTLYLLSGEDVPGSPPYGLSYESITPGEVNVTWQPPLLPNGIITHYSLELRNSTNYLNLTSRTNFIHITHLRKYTKYQVVVQAHTHAGPGNYSSEPLNITTLEDVPNGPVSNLTYQIFSSTAVIVSWDPPTEPNGRPYYLLTLQEAGIFPNMTNQGTPAVNKTIKQTTTDNVYLFTKLRKYFAYVLTVTPATGAGPAYNHTTTMHLRTDDDIPSSPPVLLSTKNLTSSSIQVVWQRPLEANGEITDYTLILSGPGGPNTTQTLNTSVIFTNLIPYTAYNLTIISATRKGVGPPLLLQLHTDEGGPMSPPRNLTIFNHTAVSVWLSWEPPLEPNGVVIKYGFRIRDLVTDTVTHQNTSGSSTMKYLSGFRPYSSYEISVCSFTRVGHGNQFSLPVTFTTNESVSDVVGNLSCSGLTWDTIQLSWEIPENPNGQLLFYNIIVQGDMETFTLQATSPEYTLSGLSPNQEYTLSVAAVNSAGPGDQANCITSTLSESVPAAPRFLVMYQVTPSNVTLQWAPPLHVPGLLKEYLINAQLLSTVCGANLATSSSEVILASDCIVDNFTVSANASDNAAENSITLQSLAKYRWYRFRVAAVTNAGIGEHTHWIYELTLAGDPDAPPRDLVVTSTSTSLHITWEEPAVLSGPTSYLVQVDGPSVNISIVRSQEEVKTVVVTNLTAFTRYNVTLIAFTGSLEHAKRDGKAIGPITHQTLEAEPNDPPKNVNVTAIPEEVKSVTVSFSPPEEPNGIITDYVALVYEKEKLIKNISLRIIQTENNTLTADVEGLKGGHNYSIQISAKNGAGWSPLSQHFQITTGIKAPSKPTQTPQAMLGNGGVAMVTHKTITVRKPACFYSDDNGPIAKIQVIVAESGVRDQENITNWRSAFYLRPAPYLTDEGFYNPPCSSVKKTAAVNTHFRGGQPESGDGSSLVRFNQTTEEGYVIGGNNACLEQNNTDHFCNGPLKPNTVYVFKFRATNIRGQYTDSVYSEHVRTASADGLLTREEQIILGVLLSFFLALFFIIIICVSVKLHQHKKEGGTYSPREAEIIETKCKLDQLIAVADMELKQEKLNRYSSFFFKRKEIYVIQLLSYRKSLKPVNKKSFLQHVEDLCANDNSKFQEEFAELPKLLQDLATTDADLPWNKSKNRFPNIKPYNNNRVKLLSEPGTAGSDFINASFVSGYLCPNEFIATQGPLPGTVADFWRMIWETGTRSIAMLTQCYEKGRIRCHKYWPEDNKPMTVFSDILISKVSEEAFPDWTIRTLKVEKHGHYILVKHFNYTSWPEHGVPESCSTFIKFVKAIRSHRHDNSTIAVHCSAGVGRTGVFIALDHLIQHVRDHEFVDIYGLVAELRSERMCMVQNLAQYIFLHQCTLELLNNKGNSQSIWFVSYSALEKMDSLDNMEGDVELEWEETTM